MCQFWGFLVQQEVRDMKISLLMVFGGAMWRRKKLVHRLRCVYWRSVERPFILRVMMWHWCIGIVFPVIHIWSFCCLGITRSGQRSTSTMFCRSTRRRSWVHIDLLHTYFLWVIVCHEKQCRIRKSSTNVSIVVAYHLWIWAIPYYFAIHLLFLVGCYRAM